MSVLDVIILSIVEGLTEFLPISSTGHMIAAAGFMKIDQTAATSAFEVIIQLGAILAVAVDYKDKLTMKYLPLWIKIIAGFLPVAVVGLIFHEQVKAMFSVRVVGIMLIIGGVVFIIAEFLYRRVHIRVRTLDAIGLKAALFAGFAQVLALVPGTSRAGVVILGAMFAGADRKTGTELSFLMALPVMVAASGFDLINNYQTLRVIGLGKLGLGFLIAFITAYASIRVLIRFVKNNSLIGFGIYRILFGALILLCF